MQAFICPQCGHESTYDPWIESAHCDRCGYAPATKGVRLRRLRPKKQTGTHQPFLDELLAHWNGTHRPDPEFKLQTPDLALGFFREYQRALGEDPFLLPGRHMRYVRAYHPRDGEILTFVGAYLLLKQGDRAGAARRLGALTFKTPEFTDAWVWLSATTDDTPERLKYLEEAVIQDPANPLARDALALARGKVAPVGARAEREAGQAAATVKCPNCGGALHYEPGAPGVTCPYCGHQVDLETVRLLEQEAASIGDLQLQRRYRGHAWGEVQRIVHCQPCGAELTMTRHLARQCAFCGSTSVLVQDNRRTFEQPDGFLPFQVDRRQAAEAIDHAQRAGLRGLKTWLTGRGHQVEDLQGVYLPFWVFDGFVEVRTWTVSGPLPAPPQGDLTIPTDMVVCDNLLFSGVEVPAPSLLRRAFPFQLKALVPYEPRLLADWPAALYQRDVEVAVEEAYDMMIDTARRRARPLVSSETASSSPTSTPTRFGRSFQVSSVTYQLVLLPVWVISLRRDDKPGLALVNGQTGKVAFGRARLGELG